MLSKKINQRFPNKNVTLRQRRLGIVAVVFL